MITSELHTLESLMTHGVKIKGANNPIEIPYIFIPKIQRAYAQGRQEESDVRRDFLSALFDTLTSDENVSLELSFLFGSQQVLAKRSEDNNIRGFELLDGQQRTTTLFLLYWYISMKEQKTVPNFLSKFTYDTRDTSIQFLKNITDASFSIDLEKFIPSEGIKTRKWFTDDYYCDSTVCAMLNMLDEIHKKYDESKCSKLYERLSRLNFYVLMLEEFDMNDELYIKMNSRGLPLIPFENFKASIIKFMKASGLYGGNDVKNGQVPYWFSFTSKMDAKWIDLFWKYSNNSEDECSRIINIDDKKIGVHYFNFINRYLFTKSCIDDKLSDCREFFYTDTESEKIHKRLFGWEKYEKIFKSDNYFCKLEKVMDELCSSWESIKGEINKDPYENVRSFDLQKDDITIPERVIFAAITEFIEQLPPKKHIDDVKENFNRMLRVVFNIIENTAIESMKPAIGVIKTVSEIIRAKDAINGIFYHSLATETFNSRNHQLQEEIEKAKQMCTNGTFNVQWEKEFIEAEQHPFFKGSILFFLQKNSSGTIADFKKRFEVVRDMFDGYGITAKYKQEHILIRAIVSCINYWDKGLENRYITEKAEKEKYLKMLLTNYSKVRDMFCDYFENHSSEDIVDYLTSKINSATPEESEPNGFKLLFNRMVNNCNASALFDWIAEREEATKKYFYVQYNRNSYLINIYRAWYDRIILDTERHLIIPNIIKKFTMEYEDINQKNMMQGPVKDAYGWNIDIIRTDGNYKMLLSFKEYKCVEFYIYGNNIKTLADTFNTPIENKQNDCIKISSIPYQSSSDQQKIEEEINRLSHILDTI